MLNFLMHSGLMNVTLWATVLTFLAVLVSRLRTNAGLQTAATVPAFLVSRLFLGVLAAGTFLNLGYGLYKAYSSPRDLMQDIISAQEFLAGRSLYPDRMNELMRQAYEREPPRPSLFWWSATLEAQEGEARERSFTEHWVQAHPPMMTLCVAPFVAAGGVLGAQLAVLLLSLAGLALSLFLIGRGLGWELSRRYWLVIVLGLLGAEPIVNTLRSGQSGLLLGTLMVLGWYALRRGRSVLAGVAIALATALKMYPGLLLVYLLLRHRRAFTSAVVTLLLVVVLIGTLAGWATFAEYVATTRGVVAEYQRYSNNLSLLGLASRTLGIPGETGGKERVFFCGLALAAVAAAAWVARPRLQGKEVGTALDAEFALFVALMPLLSPITWDHYLSILLLPMAVVGTRALTPGGPRSATLGFLGIAVILCVPDTSFTRPLKDLENGPLWSVATLLYMPLRTYALIALCLWLGAVIHRARKEIAETSAVREGVPAGALLIGVLLVLGLAHVAAYVPGEPYFNGDETRHVMTGVYVRDLLLDHPIDQLRDYTVRYYVQYPALGLLVWPPFFYFVEGVFMLAFGTCFLAAQVLVGLFVAMACVYLFFLVMRTHGRETAAVAVLFFGLSPLVFTYSARVMLEVPALALALMAVYHCQRYLDAGRRLDLALCCLATALTALTRFDGVFLAPLFLIWLAGVRRLGLLKRWEVLLGMAAAVLLVAPFYLLTARELGGAHLKAVKEGTGATSTGFLAPENFLYYPAHIPEQIGWVMVVPALVGFVAALRAERRSSSWPYLAMMAATYLTFTPMAELEARHAIYWVPALAVFAVEGCRLIADWKSREPVLRWSLCAVVLAGTGWITWQEQGLYVRGYDEAARYVVENSKQTPVCLFDGFLNGDFIYQVRRYDPARRLWVLRGDKLFYGVLSDPHGGYAEWAKTPEEVLDLLFKYDPELIVVEDPQIYFDLPGARLLRQVLEDHPERFRREKEFPLSSNHVTFRGKRLLVYRNLLRNPKRAEILEIKMLGLGRSLQAAP